MIKEDGEIVILVFSNQAVTVTEISCPITMNVVESNLSCASQPRCNFNPIRVITNDDSVRSQITECKVFINAVCNLRRTGPQ